MKLNELRELMGRATPGPWKEDRGDIEAHMATPGKNGVQPHSLLKGWDDGSAWFNADEDAQFVVALVNAAPKLLAVVEAAKALDDEVNSKTGTIAFPRIHSALKALENA